MVMGLIEREETAYKCLCVSPRGGNPFLDTIRVQNVPYNPIKVEGGVLRRSGTSNRYIGEYNCNLNGCETYTLDVFNALDSIQYKVAKSWVEYTCLGRKL